MFQKLGYVIVGLFLLMRQLLLYKKPTFLEFEKENYIKKLKNKSIKSFSKSKDYIPNVKKIKPDFVVHGDDWKKGPHKPREQLKKVLKKWGGKLVEPKYIKNISSSKLKEKLKKVYIYFK